jgi:hypothetical protein
MALQLSIWQALEETKQDHERRVAKSCEER